MRRFVAEGGRVVGVDIVDRDGSPTAMALVDELGKTFEYRRTDVSDPTDISGAVRWCADHFGSVDVLFNNAAWTSVGYIPTLDLAEWDRSLRVMLSASLYSMQAAIPLMVSGGGGSIINVSSVYGLVSNPGNAPYSTAKAGLINLTRTAALEYGRKGIRANAICPGVVDTPLLGQVLDAGLITREQVAEKHAIGRIIQPKEVGLPPRSWRVADWGWSLAFAGRVVASGCSEALSGDLRGWFHAALPRFAASAARWASTAS